MPLESSIIAILLVARETIQTGRVRGLFWCDTRDMLVDGMNKGSISRKALVDCMKTGIWTVSHPPVRHVHKQITSMKTRLMGGYVHRIGAHPPYPFPVDQNHAPQVSQTSLSAYIGYSISGTNVVVHPDHSLYCLSSLD